MNQDLDILKYLTVLYLEDDDTTREKMTSFLSKFVKEVKSTDYIDDALNIFEENHIDIIISDIDLPDDNKNGLDFTKEIRSQNTNIPIILITAHNDTSYLLEAIKIHLVDYISKPVDLKLLLQALNDSAKVIINNGNFNITFTNGSKYNLLSKTLIIGDDEIQLSLKEYGLLDILLKYRNRAVSQDEIFTHLWDFDEGTVGSLKTLINKVRNKVGKESIINISKVGYQIVLN